MEGLQVIDHGAVVELRFDRVAKKNAITGAMYGAMTAALADAEARAAVRVVLFSAEGEVFSAGNDIADFVSMPDLTDAPPSRFIVALARFGKPLVAAVPGLAVGVGATLLLHCDLVYAAPGASFSMPFVDLGLVPEAGSSLLLPALVGPARAAAMLLLGDALPAADAAAAGLVNALVPAETVRAHAMAAALRLAGKPPLALAASRALLRRGRGALEEQMRAEQAAFGAALQGGEARAAFAAFLARRPR